jgi:hypothetical protein
VPNCCTIAASVMELFLRGVFRSPVVRSGARFLKCKIRYGTGTVVATVPESVSVLYKKGAIAPLICAQL